MLVIAGDIGGLYSMDLNPTNLEAATLRAKWRKLAVVLKRSRLVSGLSVIGLNQQHASWIL